MFLLTVVASLHFATKRRWLLSGTSALFASLTIGLGVMIFFPLAREYLKRSKLKLNYLSLKRLASSLPLLLPWVVILRWSLYNFWFTGDPLRWPHATAGWSVSFSPPWASLVVSSSLAAFCRLPFAMCVINDHELITEFVLLYVVTYAPAQKNIEGKFGYLATDRYLDLSLSRENRLDGGIHNSPSIRRNAPFLLNNFLSLIRMLEHSAFTDIRVLHKSTFPSQAKYIIIFATSDK